MRLRGPGAAANWIQFQGETGKLRRQDVKRRPLAVAARGQAGERIYYRYQIQGPNAEEDHREAQRRAFADIKFFNMGYINIAGRKVRALRHGMSGEPGLEIWGPYAEGEEINAAILEAGQRVRPGPGRRARLCHQHAGIGLDPLAAAGRLYRREDEALSRVASGRRL